MLGSLCLCFFLCEEDRASAPVSRLAAAAWTCWVRVKHGPPPAAIVGAGTSTCPGPVHGLLLSAW